MASENLQSIQSMYDARSDVYDQNMVHVEQARDFINWAQLKPGHSLLDLACGTGLVTIAAKVLSVP